MSLKVVIPTPLRKHTGGAEVVEVDAGTVKEVIDRLESRFPGIRNSVCDDSGVSDTVSAPREEWRRRLARRAHFPERHFDGVDLFNHEVDHLAGDPARTALAVQHCR